MAVALTCLATLGQVYAATIETVLVGNPDNPGNGVYGSVGYNYRIGKYEVTNGQYVEFLNSADPTGGNALALYDSKMSTDALGGIIFTSSAADGSKYSVKAGRDNNPVVFVSWYDSIRFANWLHNDRESGDTENGAYTLLGGTPTPSNGPTITRNPGAKWWLPSEDEWYKAAYHKNDGVTGNYWGYPTSTTSTPYSDQPPGTDAPDPSNTANFYKDDGIANGYDDGLAVTGSTPTVESQNYLTDVGAYSLATSPYGTFDQGGNVWEWNETPLSSSFRVVRGGSWYDNFLYLRSVTRIEGIPTFGGTMLGFRVASSAEPLLPGDFNHDGSVDAADYVFWRKSDGTQDGYDTWRANFGRTLLAASGAGTTGAEQLAPSVPEPTTILLLVFGAAGAFATRRRFAKVRPLVAVANSITVLAPPASATPLYHIVPLLLVRPVSPLAHRPRRRIEIANR